MGFRKINTSYSGNASKEEREVADNALCSVSCALIETCLYVNRDLAKEERDEEVEAHLPSLLGTWIVNFQKFASIRVSSGLTPEVGISQRPNVCNSSLYLWVF